MRFELVVGVAGALQRLDHVLDRLLDRDVELCGQFVEVVVLLVDDGLVGALVVDRRLGALVVLDAGHDFTVAPVGPGSQGRSTLAGVGGDPHHRRVDAKVGDRRLLDEIVIGLDGAERSHGAVEWIADIVPDGGVVHTVHAVRPESHPDAAEEAGDVEAWAAELRDALDGRGSTATVVAHFVEASPADALLSVAGTTGACMIVVGSHDQAFVHPKLIGRTVAQLVHETPVPLVIVGAHHAARLDGTVVAGVGSGETTNSSVAWAAAFAEERRSGLALVRAVHRDSLFTPEGVLTAIAWYLDPGKLAEWAHEDLQRVAHFAQQATETEIGIELEAPVGKVGPELVEAAEDAEVLVIGRPSRGPGVDHMVPPWLHHAIAHAPCPVVIVPGDG